MINTYQFLSHLLHSPESKQKLIKLLWKYYFSLITIFDVSVLQMCSWVLLFAFFLYYVINLLVLKIVLLVLNIRTKEIKFVEHKINILVVVTEWHILFKMTILGWQFKTWSDAAVHLILSILFFILSLTIKQSIFIYWLYSIFVFLCVQIVDIFYSMYPTYLLQNSH